VQRSELTPRLIPLLATLPEEVVTVYLFGSFARDTARANSDVDLAFWRRTRSEPTFAQQPYALAGWLEGELGRAVDLVELNRAPPDLVHRVLRDGKILLDRDPRFRIHAEVSARSAYLDLLPVLRRHRAAGAKL
jgi:predicted nucleotidyltransferase